MSNALKPFDQYIQYLADGTLDCYVNSTPPMASSPDLLDVRLPKSNNLLLHDLGNHPDEARLHALFKHDIVFVIRHFHSGNTILICLL